MDRKHFKCLFWKALWGLGALSLIAAWFSFFSGPLLALDALVWLWNALIFAVLSIPIKLDCRACEVCKIGPSM